jgi:hypothetical protein
VVRLLFAIGENECSASQLREALGIKHRPTFRKNYIDPALEAGYIALTIPEKLMSHLQKYRLTEKGQAFLKGESSDHAR